jgi:hypothetical protein
MIRAYKNAWLRTRLYRALLVLNYIAQPATFWRRPLTETLGGLDAGLHYTMDYEYWLRIGQAHRLHVLKEDLAAFRLHSGSKSGGTAHLQFDEELKVARRYARGLIITLHLIHRILLVFFYRNILQTGKNPGIRSAD